MLAFAFLCIPGSAAWNCAGDGRWEVCVDGSTRRAQAVFGDLRLLESAWTAKNGALPELAPGIQAMLYRNKGEYQPFQLISTSLGLFQSGPERDWILVLDQGEAASRAARHEWVHRALYHTTPGLPLWLEEGLAEYWSTLEGSGGQARLGKPSENHIKLLEDRPWLPAREFFGATKESEVYLDDRRAGVLYAQSWAVVHLLAQHPEWKGRLEAYLATLATGADAREAFRLTWGRDQEQALEASRGWIKSAAMTSETVALGAGLGLGCTADAHAGRSRIAHDEGRGVVGSQSPFRCAGID